ncbi:MAG: hybrid sensor histidine kinase/response regulator [Desulfobacteraceae bacterium A6]|nr:MAG: hybrid sensor histidine kinase/response regulator [Desulfobacteraceae bacterium A6]
MPDTVLEDVIKRLTEYAKGILSHDFQSEPVRISPDPFNINELSSAIEQLATEYRYSLLRAEETMWAQATAEKQMEEMLLYETSILNTMADGLIAIDPNGIIDIFNPVFLSMFNLSDREISGREYNEIFAADLTSLIGNVMSEKKETIMGEISLADGRIGRAIVTPILNSEFLGSVVLVHDVTKEKEIDGMKTDFISTVSHELRTPLTSVLGFAKIIKRKLNDDIFPQVKTEDKKIHRAINQVDGNIGIIISEGERLTKLINDVLDIAKMEAGKIEWKKEALSVGEIIERAATATSALFEQKGLRLVKDIEDGLPEITGDRDRLMQVIINLISNAVKFTDKGSITCRAKKVWNEKEELADFVEISVIDTGIGVTKEDYANVFEKFKQVGDVLTDKPTGTGLGLPICKQIVGHHGGRIWVESEFGKGSAFSFTLPVRRESGISMEAINKEIFIRQLREHIAIAPQPTVSGKTILAVDDDPNIREFLRQELEAAGYRVNEASDGIEAINMIKKQRPDLIILDIMMPKMSGFDVAAVIKNDPATMDIPIIILSIIEDRERGYRVGIDKYLTKPVNTEELLHEIEILISEGVSKKKVLVVDEDETTVKTLSEALATKGYNVVSVCNGNECIARAKVEKPDMIIMDAVISERNDIVKTLRFEKGLENVYFILMGKGKE